MAKKTPQRTGKRRFLVWLIAACSALIALLYITFFLPNPSGVSSHIGGEEIIVPRGATLSDVADSLASHDILRSKLTFKLAAKLLGSSSKIQPGHYNIAFGLTNTTILSRLTGKEYAIVFEITIPEGSHIRRIASIAQARLGLDSSRVVLLAHDSAFLESLELPKELHNAEGYLFPDTYKFYVSLTPEELLRRMHSRWKEVVADSLISRAKELGLSTHELMTLASIVEGETQAADERDTVAGVYWNRLRKGMKLDADPTVKYGLGLDRPITAAQLRIENPYNTYLNPGLPPGPINNPGLAAIKAALYPAEHNKLYFVSRGDGSGRHFFSATMQEHEKMIARSNRNNRLR